MASTKDLTTSLGNAPQEFAKKPRVEMKHTVTLNIPMASQREATQLYHVLRIDKELKPIHSFTAYKIDLGRTPETLDIQISCTSVRQLRLSTNALLESISLVVQTIGTFGPMAEGSSQSVLPDTTTEAEFELSGTGRAG